MAGYNFSQNIIGLKKTNGDIHELEVEVADLSASVLTIGEKLENITEYSEEEKIVGTWLNGETLYEKVVSCGTLPNATATTILHEISNIEKIVSLSGIALRTTVGTTLSGFSLPYIFSFQDTINYATLSANATQIAITTNFDGSQYNESYVILKYTKSVT